MARRDASSSSRSSRSTTRSSAASGKGARTRSDGKVDIFCPQCGAQYRIAETALESKLECASCHRVFFPKAVAGKRAKAQDYTKVYVGLGVGALFVIGSLVLMSRGGNEPAQRPPVVADTAGAQLQIDRKARCDQALRWARAMGAADLATLKTYSDVADVAKSLGLEASLSGPALDQAIADALPKHEGARLFREMDCTSAVVDEEAVKKNGGAISLYLATKSGDTTYDAKAGAMITAQWRLDGTQFKVGAFALTQKPIVRGRRPGDESKTFVPSAEIARPKMVETDRGGAKVQVKESDPVAIAHLADTPEPLRQKIDGLVKDLIASADPESPGALFNRSVTALREIGKPAMPRLINALYELYPDVNGNNQKISQVTRCLLDLTGMAFAYDVKGTGDAAKDKAARESVIRQWFAFWWRYANGDYQESIDKTEDLLDASSSKTKDGK